jgi:Tautomerase enzyme
MRSLRLRTSVTRIWRHAVHVAIISQAAVLVSLTIPGSNREKCEPIAGSVSYPNTIFLFLFGPLRVRDAGLFLSAPLCNQEAHFGRSALSGQVKARSLYGIVTIIEGGSNLPDVLVEVNGSWLGQRKVQFLDAIQASLVEALRIPPGEKVLRLIEHPRENFLIPHTAGERFTRIEIVMFAGRSHDTKRALYKAIVAHLAAFDVPPNDIKIVLIEIPEVNAGLRGGQAACDIDLGYKIAL